MSKNPILSICIPTFNFGLFLEETLNSFLKASSHSLEIVVVDGGSTDDTPVIMKEVMKNHSNVVYFRREEKIGVDRDIAKAVELASGEYCWLFSSDDVVREGAVDRILREISYRCDVYLCNRIECDVNMNMRIVSPWLQRTVPDEIFYLSSDKDFQRYLRKARSIGALFSYISSLVISRDRWNSVPCPEDAYSTNYAHAYRILAMREGGLKVKYISDPQVLCRGENDSFRAQGMLKRILIDIDGYNFLANHLLKSNQLENDFRAVMIREHPYFWLIRTRDHLKDTQEWHLLMQRLREFGYAAWRLELIIIISAVRLLLQKLRKAVFISS